MGAGKPIKNKLVGFAKTTVAQLIGHPSRKPRVGGLIPGWGTYLGSSLPQVRAYTRGNPSMFVSLFLSLYSLSLKINK